MDFYKSTTFYLVLIKSPWAFKVPYKKRTGGDIYIYYNRKFYKMSSFLEKRKEMKTLSRLQGLTKNKGGDKKNENEKER